MNFSNQSDHLNENSLQTQLNHTKRYHPIFDVIRKESTAGTAVIQNNKGQKKLEARKAKNTSSDEKGNIEHDHLNELSDKNHDFLPNYKPESLANVSQVCINKANTPEYISQSHRVVESKAKNLCSSDFHLSKAMPTVRKTAEDCVRSESGEANVELSQILKELRETKKLCKEYKKLLKEKTDLIKILTELNQDLKCNKQPSNTSNDGYGINSTNTPVCVDVRQNKVSCAASTDSLQQKKSTYASVIDYGNRIPGTYAKQEATLQVSFSANKSEEQRDTQKMIHPANETYQGGKLHANQSKEYQWYDKNRLADLDVIEKSLDFLNVTSDSNNQKQCNDFQRAVLNSCQDQKTLVTTSDPVCKKETCYNSDENSIKTNDVDDEATFNILTNKHFEINKQVRDICYNLPFTNSNEMSSKQLANSLTHVKKDIYFDDISDSASYDEKNIKVIKTEQQTNDCTLKALQKRHSIYSGHEKRILQNKNYQIKMQNKYIIASKMEKYMQPKTQTEAFKALYTSQTNSFQLNDKNEKENFDNQNTSDPKETTKNDQLYDRSYDIQTIDKKYAEFVREVARSVNSLDAGENTKSVNDKNKS